MVLRSVEGEVQQMAGWRRLCVVSYISMQDVRQAVFVPLLWEGTLGWVLVVIAKLK